MKSKPDIFLRMLKWIFFNSTFFKSPHIIQGDYRNLIMWLEVYTIYSLFISLFKTEMKKTVNVFFFPPAVYTALLSQNSLNPILGLKLILFLLHKVIIPNSINQFYTVRSFLLLSFHLCQWWFWPDAKIRILIFQRGDP